MKATFLDIFGAEYPSSKLQKMSFFNGKRILILGSQGMIGNAFSQILLEGVNRGIFIPKEVLLASRNWIDYPKSQEISNFQRILNTDLDRIDKNIDILIHCASPSNITKYETFNELDYANTVLLENALKLKPIQVLYISSSEVYAGQETNEESKLVPLDIDNKRNWYPLVKRKCEEVVKEYSNLNPNISANCIRLFHTFGPGLAPDDGRSFADIIWAGALNKPIVLHSDGSQVRSFLYISDALNAFFVLLFNSKLGCEEINVGSLVPNSILDFAQTVQRITEVDLKKLPSSTFQHSPFNTILPKLRKISDYGWEPDVSLESGILKTIYWAKNSIEP